MTQEQDLPHGADWIPDVLPQDLLTRETEYRFGDGMQMALLRLAEVECNLTWQDLMRKYLFLGMGIYRGSQTGEYQFIRRVGEEERPLSLQEEVSWEGTHWKEIVTPTEGESEIVFKTRNETTYKLLEVADSLGVSIPVVLGRTLDLGLRMSYELRYRDDIAYYLKTNNGSAVRINESRLGGTQ